MLTNTWSIALLICSAITLFLIINGVRTGWRILRFWQWGSPSELQIQLEEDLFLSGVLVEFGCIIQLFSVLLLVMAADYFATLLTGAMCSAGALSANGYGMPALLLKLVTFLVSLSWIILHNLDIRSEYYPLVKLKYILLFLLLPLAAAEMTLLTLYLSRLDPDIITSCCGVLFSSQTGDGYDLLSWESSTGVIVLFSLLSTALFVLSMTLGQKRIEERPRYWLGWLSIGLWWLFYFGSLIFITIHTSPYVYAMPHHRCPFDLLTHPNRLAGVLLYVSLHAAVIFGLAGAIAALVELSRGLGLTAARVRMTGSRLCLLFLVAFYLINFYYPLIYRLRGGEG